MDGSKRRALSKQLSHYPLSLTVTDVVNRDLRFKPSAAKASKDRLPIGSRAFINAGKYKGFVGVVKGHSQTPRGGDLVKVEINEFDQISRGDGGKARKIAKDLALKWYPLHEVARYAHVPTLAATFPSPSILC